MRDELDADIADLQALLAESAPSKAAMTGADAYAARAKKTEEDVNYDQYVRDMAYDARAKPKDRTKTEDELALEEKERLEAAEAKRLRRMRGEESEDEDEQEEGGRKRRKKERREADDLDDDFEEEDLLGPGLTREDLEAMGKEVAGVSGDDEEEDEEGSEDGSEEGESGEEDDEEEDDDEDEEDDDDDEDDMSSMADLDDDAPDLVPVEDGVDLAEEISQGKRKRDTVAKGKGKTTEIPYTFPCHSSIEEFEEIMDPLHDSALPTVVQRIRAIHHPSLAQGNKEKLQVSFKLLFEEHRTGMIKS